MVTAFPRERIINTKHHFRPRDSLYCASLDLEDSDSG